MAYETGSDRVHSVTDPVTGTTTYTYGIAGERRSLLLPGSSTAWTYTYATGGDGHSTTNCDLPKDDPNSVCLHLVSLTDDQGRRVDFNVNTAANPSSGPTFDGRLYSVRSDQTFSVATQALTSYCETDYSYNYTSAVNATRLAAQGWLMQVTTTWNWLSGTLWQQKVLSKNDYTQQGSDATTGYDPMGQRLSNTVTDQTGAVRTERYAYDDLSRLKTVDYGDGQTQSYGFDAMGNRLQRVDSVSGTTTSAYDAANRLTGTTGAGASAYTNDADGNTLTGAGRTNTWDSQNRLVSCALDSATTTYTYGADGLRRRATTLQTVHQLTAGQITPASTGTDYAYDGTMLVREGQALGEFRGCRRSRLHNQR